MEKIVNIGGNEILMKATANTPKRYRETFGKDLLIELQKLYGQVDKKTGAFIGEVDFSLVENLAFTMARQADDSLDDQEEWLDQFELVDLYNAMPEILSVWSESTTTLSQPKKK